MKYLDQDKLDRTIWISPINASFNEVNLRNFFEEKHECGLVKDVRVYHGNSIPGKPSENRYAMIEFVEPNSVARSLRIASKQQSNLNGTKFRIYKAGTANMGTATDPKAAKSPATRHVGRGGRGRGKGRA